MEEEQMGAATSACASSGMVWDGINWAEVQRHVRRLQVRIVKATQAGRHGKAKALQWLLTHSFSGKALAVKRVTENKGKNTPGVDKVTWNTLRAKTNAIASLRRRGYSTLPLRRVLIPKKNGKTRPLGIPVMKCRAMQALHLLALEPIAETTADPNSYGFRPERSTADAGEQCFIVLAPKARAQWILEADIKSCFDQISHDWMLANIPMDKAMLRKWLKAGYVYQNSLFPTDAGTPQGGIISPVLANMTLDGLETLLAKKFPKWRRGLKMNMVRYADDFIITGTSKEWLEQEVKPIVVEFLAERGLALSAEKTKITHITEGFDFLGWNIRKYGDKLLMKPSKVNVKAHLDKIREVIKANRTAKQANLIVQLNPILQGWANYHRHVVAKKVFGRNDHTIWSMLWRWARRRHPNKGVRWVKERYFKTTGTRSWIFAVNEEKEDGTKRELFLLKESDKPIQRHVKIKSKANPHDPKWASYFEARWARKMLISPKGRAKLYRIWLRQDRQCPDCQKPITKNTRWELRWAVKRTDGGTDKAGNLYMHHLNCHGVRQHADIIHGETGHQHAFEEA
jgi:RNA-directed DNA polymerase